jgi:serine/threonine protein kinase
MATSDQVDVKLIDFGYIVEMNDVRGDEKGALDENVAGTPWYIAPEIICSFFNANSKLRYTTKSDTWAVGVIFCELVTGKHPCYFSPRYTASKKTKNLTQIQQITLQYQFH